LVWRGKRVPGETPSCDSGDTIGCLIILTENERKLVLFKNGKEMVDLSDGKYLPSGKAIRFCVCLGEKSDAVITRHPLCSVNSQDLLTQIADFECCRTTQFNKWRLESLGPMGVNV